MGMAASQARLLSITSRMADNELRAQLINNAKMRLTEDTAKASDKYISALNKTQYMMSNKDTLGNDMYQQLTFNNLTAYSSYNNQYGLINRSGELVVSELDAAKYETAIENAKNNPETDALTEFLSQYGIERDDTSYWKNPKIPADMEARYEGDIKYDDDLNRISGLHYGYEMSKDSTEVTVYEYLLDKYTDADKAYTQAVSKAMKDYLFNYRPNGHNKNYKDKYDEVLKYNTGDPVVTPSISDSLRSLDLLKQLFSHMTSNGYIKKDTIDQNGRKIPSPFYEAMDFYLNDSIQSNGSGATINTPVNITTMADGYNIRDGAFLITGTSGNYTVAAGPNANTKPNPVPSGQEYTYHIYSPNSGVTNNNGQYTFTYNDTEVEVDENGNETRSTQVQTCVFETSPLQAYLSEQADPETAADAVKEVYKFFQQNVYSQMDRDKFGHLAPNELAAFNNAAKELSIYIFGVDIGQQDYDKLDDMDWIINSGKPTTNLDGSTKVTIPQNIEGNTVNMEYLANFEAIKDIYLVEQMIAEFGAPKYTWIDKNDPNENADAKAQWYTNIFERMQESGYQKIELALTQSADWIQFALESGLLSMVQVDDEYKWVSTMYSNCSDITEDTVELEITKAEAEYKRETNKIQAKDKRYDIELKNIDTEHNSLQTEYESIKSVIDKNIERHFKLFG